MRRLLARRLATLPFTLVGLATLVFIFVRLVPGDPVEIMLGESAAPLDVERLRHDLGLDAPLPVALAAFLARAGTGDLGYSLSHRAPVTAVIAGRYPATLELAAAAFALALVLAIPLGALAATFRRTAIDRAARVLSLAGVCLPTPWLGPLLILAFSIHLGWLPVSGRGGAAHLVLPAVTLALGMSGILVRLTRSSLLAALREDHVRVAAAKGASTARVVLRHALPNALVPVATVAALQVGALLAGAVITETVFAWPGIGRLLVQAIQARDYPLIQGCVLAIGATYVAVNTLADAVLGLLDPRVRDA